MAAARHNLSRRALLGVGVGLCVGEGVRMGGLPAVAGKTVTVYVLARIGEAARPRSNVS